MGNVANWLILILDDRLPLNSLLDQLCKQRCQLARANSLLLQEVLATSLTYFGGSIGRISPPTNIE